MSGLVVKLGGHALDTLALDSLELVDLAQDVAHLRAAGTNVAIVHGGGPQIAALLDSLGIASTFHEGLRVTDDATMDGVVMALGRVNLLISTALNQAGLVSVGLSGADAALFRASPLGAIWGRASAVPKVCDDIITTLWAAGVTPVVSPIAVDDHGGLLNCNADTAAGALAGALGADELVLLSDVDQLRASFDDAASAMASVSGEQVAALLSSNDVRDGMRPKLTAALDALGAGARRVLVANGTRRHALRDALSGAIPTTEVLS
ncbi:MAG: acetylglutamate kinase [Acidimicrobiales bacterium]